MGFSHNFPSLNDAIIYGFFLVEAVLGSSKARWRGSREVLLWSHRPGEGPFFSGSMADGSFVRLGFEFEHVDEHSTYIYIYIYIYIYTLLLTV